MNIPTIFRIDIRNFFYSMCTFENPDFLLTLSTCLKLVIRSLAAWNACNLPLGEKAGGVTALSRGGQARVPYQLQQLDDRPIFFPLLVVHLLLHPKTRIIKEATIFAPHAGLYFVYAY